MSVRLGTTTVADEAIVSIVRGAVAGVPGARLDLPGRVSRVLPRIAESVRDAVSEHVAGMTGLQVRVVDVTVTAIDRVGTER